jgi:hypothetical protein
VEAEAAHAAAVRPAAVSTWGFTALLTGMPATDERSRRMYIGGGVITLIIIILILVWLF